jgi:hypothetical protein
MRPAAGETQTSAPSPCSAEPGFSAAASFAISTGVGFLFGLHPGTRIALTGCLLLMIHNFNRSKRIFTTKQSVAHALAGAYGAVNAVSLYVEHGTETFHFLHVECAQRLATQARQAGLERVVHVSGIGADPASPSLYVRKRGEGELAVRSAFANALLIRPAVMFGPDDSFLTTIITLLERLPIYLVGGSGAGAGFWQPWKLDKMVSGWRSNRKSSYSI